MKLRIFLLVGIAFYTCLNVFPETPVKGYTLTVEVKQLRSSKGVVQFALYNEDGTIPDEQFKKYYKIGKSEIVDGKSIFTFNDLPEDVYAISIHHDENENGKIDKGLIKPKEGIGFSNYQSIGFSNRPNFSKASFELDNDKKISIKVVYM